MLAIGTAPFAGSRSRWQSKSISEPSRNHGRHELILFYQLHGLGVIGTAASAKCVQQAVDHVRVKVCTRPTPILHTDKNSSVPCLKSRFVRETG